MQLIKKTKKGFTLVELIVVIAIVAILAAVSVVSYVAFINSANESADLQLVKQINLCMEASEALHGKNPTMHDALTTAFDNGFVIENLTPRSNKDIVWNSDTDRFELLEKAPASHAEKYFKIYNSVAEMMAGQTAEGYSAYLNSEEQQLSEKLTLVTGFDAGDNQYMQKIEYINETESEANRRSVIIRTNSGDLLVNAQFDTVKHYGTGRYLTIENVGPTDCYHEYGVFGQAKIEEGKLVVQNSGFIGTLEDAGSGVKVIENHGTIMDATGVTSPSSTIDNQGNLNSNIVEVSTFEQLQGLAYACNNGETFEGKTIKLLNDIDMTDKVWVPFGVYAENLISWPGKSNGNIFLKNTRFFMGNIDGNGKKIINLSNKGYKTEYMHRSVSGTVGANYGLIAIATGSITIQDLEVSFNIVAEGEQATNSVGIIGQYYSQELDPIMKHVKVSDTEWDRVYDQDRYDLVNKTYELKEVDIKFINVTTSGSIIGDDAMSAYVGTTFATQHPYTFDDNGVYEWRTSKDYMEGGGVRNNYAESLEEIRNRATSGWYAEGFQIAEGSNPELHFTYNGTPLTVSGSGRCISYAPLKMNFIYENCNNSADVHSITGHARAGIFMGKTSHTVGAKIINIHFSDTYNSGSVYSAETYAGIVTGQFNASVVINIDTYEEGLTNTGTVHHNIA